MDFNSPANEAILNKVKNPSTNYDPGSVCNSVLSSDSWVPTTVGSPYISCAAGKTPPTCAPGAFTGGTCSGCFGLKETYTTGDITARYGATCPFNDIVGYLRTRYTDIHTLNYNSITGRYPNVNSAVTSYNSKLSDVQTAFDGVISSF